MSVYLDGALVTADAIAPEKHTYIGTFRSPFPPRPNGATLILCPCGRMLETVEGTRQHWAEGHFDVPQYRTTEAA